MDGASAAAYGKALRANKSFQRLCRHRIIYPIVVNDHSKSEACQEKTGFSARKICVILDPELN